MKKKPLDLTVPSIRDLKNSADSPAAILAAGYVDAALEAGISTFFKKDTTESHSFLFDEYGSLASLVPKIYLSYCLGIIGAATKYDLLKIARIRNTFAHSRSILTFAELSINKEINNLKLLNILEREKMAKSDPNTPFDALGSRDRYINTCIYVWFFIYNAVFWSERRESRAISIVAIPDQRNPWIP